MKRTAREILSAGRAGWDDDDDDQIADLAWHDGLVIRSPRVRRRDITRDRAYIDHAADVARMVSQ